MKAFKLRQTIRKQRCLVCNQEFELSDGIKSCPADGSIISPVFDDSFIGIIIDEKYTILERVASGGTSKIYKASHSTLERYVAIKLLQSGKAITETQLCRFHREAQTAIGLVHPNIVRVYDYGIHPHPYIVMEYVEGKTLAALIEEEGALPAIHALSYFVQVCNAMSMAHAAGLVHRDLKPSNVIVEQESRTAKVLDFGLVKDFVDDAKYTRTGETVGSPPYMSPEQCKGLELDARSDIYSFGCLMYEVLTGKCPFSGDNTVECMFKHLETQAPPLAKARPDLSFPQGLEKLISNCLSKDSALRYQSMTELKKDLAAVLSGFGRKIRARKKTAPPFIRFGQMALIWIVIIVALSNLWSIIERETFHHEWYLNRAWDNFESGQFEWAANYSQRLIELDGWRSQHCPYAVILVNLARRMKHNEASGRAVLTEFEKKTNTRKWPYPVIRYLRDDITSEQLLKQAGKDNIKLTEAYTYIGVDLLAKGKRGDSRKYLTWVIEHGRNDILEFDISTTLLKRIWK